MYIMLIFKHGKYYVYIHIPKNGGKYIRKKIISNQNNEVIKAYWNQDNNLDLAHIPYMKCHEYLDPTIHYHFFAHSRNPYHRLISAFFYIANINHRSTSVLEFRFFIKNILKHYPFSTSFDSNMIHYYPQYLFLCNEEFKIPNHIKIIKLETNENPTTYNLSQYYDNECIHIVNKIYKYDFQRFDYPMIDTVRFNLVLTRN